MVMTAVSSESNAKKLFKEIELTLKNLKASGIKEDYWGKRDLAYPIKSYTSAFYSVYNFSLDQAKAKELSFTLNLNDKVLRYLLSKDEKPASAK